MAQRNTGGITGKGGTNVNDIYKQLADTINKKGPLKKWGAGDPDYVKKMVESAKKLNSGKKNSK